MFTEEQILKAAALGEVSLIDTKHLITILKENFANNSNRLDGVVIQKPADIIWRLKGLIEKKIRVMEFTIYQDAGVVITANAIEEAWKAVDEELPGMLLAEHGEGYATGIETLNEVAHTSEKLLLDECCKALGWQGGTIHEIIKVLSAAKNLFNTWNGYKETLKGKPEDVNFRNMRISFNLFSEAIR